MIACVRNLLPLSLLFWVSCSSAPDGTQSPAGARLEVEVLDELFVRVDGVRQPRDEFIYQSRLASRRRAPEDAAAPAVRLTWAEGMVSQAAVDDLMTQLRLCGVEFIELGQ